MSIVQTDCFKLFKKYTMDYQQIIFYIKQSICWASKATFVLITTRILGLICPLDTLSVRQSLLINSTPLSSHRPTNLSFKRNSKCEVIVTPKWLEQTPTYFTYWCGFCTQSPLLVRLTVPPIFLCSSKFILKIYPVSFPCGLLHDNNNDN